MKYFLLALVLGIAYNVWLNYGCEVVGAMTRQGRICL